MKEYRDFVYDCLMFEIADIEFDGNDLSSKEYLALISMFNFISIALVLKDGEVKNKRLLNAMDSNDSDAVIIGFNSTLNELKNDTEFAKKFNVDVDLLPESLQELAVVAMFTLATNAKDELAYRE